MKPSHEPTEKVRPETSMTLLTLAKANEPGAWDRLVNLYSPLVSYWLRVAGASPNDHDDLLQEVFLAAATALSRFHRDQPGDNFRGWLRGISRNILLAHFRQKIHQPIGEGGTDAQRKIHNFADPHPDINIDIDLPDDDPPEQHNAIYRRALELVRNEFEQKTWEMFWQVAVEDQPVADVAQQFGVTNAAVRKAKSRVLFRLKQEVGDVLALKD